MDPILVTGFGPFEEIRDNPSAALAARLGAAEDVAAEILPVSWEHLDEFVRTTLAVRWRAVVLLGVAADRAVLSLERVAVNLCDLERADEGGTVAARERLVEHGPDAYFSTLPIHALVDALRRASVPVESSLSAGAYLCNALFYRTRHALADRATPCGFVHVPPTPGLVDGRDGVPFEVQLAALETIVDVLRHEVRG